MNRKIITVMLMLFIALASVSASVIQLGAYAEPLGWNMDEALKYDYTDIGSYAFGAEARVNLAFLQAGITAGTTKSFDNVNGMVQASLISGPKFANLTLGLGVPYAFAKGAEFNPETLLDAPLHLRAGVNLNVAFVGLSATYLIPTSLTPRTIMDLEMIAPRPDDGKLSVAVFLNLL